VSNALVTVAGLAHLALIRTRSWAANSPLERVRLKAENELLRTEVALLKEELRIKDERMRLLDAGDRPRYPPHERLAILAVRAARGWSAARTARAFLVTPPTIASWMQRGDDEGERALVRPRAPLNKVPDFVAVVVQQLRAVCPLLGKVRIAQILGRAGLSLSASSVGRALNKPPVKPLPPPTPPPARAGGKPGVSQHDGRDGPGDEPGERPRRVVTARYPHHLWHVDLTVMPTLFGFWVPWLPYALTQTWPFGVWLVLVLDHFSRSVVAHGTFEGQPSAAQVCEVLTRAARNARRAPRHMVSDQGPQFQSEYRLWCRAHGVKPRFGAVGQHGSIAIIERFIRSMKDECFRTLVVPLTAALIEQELKLWLGWYHDHRPHQGMSGKTPMEMLARRARRRSRSRPRAARRRRRRLRPRELVVSHLGGRAHLPIIELRPAG
jgi:transposase InsO family protein